MAYVDLLSRLEDILEAIDEAQRFTAGMRFEDYLANPLVRRGVERCIEIVSEASRHIPAKRKAAHPQVPWRNIADIGNVLRHGYRLVDHKVIWSVVGDHLPALHQGVQGAREQDRRAARAGGETPWLTSPESPDHLPFPLVHAERKDVPLPGEVRGRTEPACWFASSCG